MKNQDINCDTRHTLILLKHFPSNFLHEEFLLETSLQAALARPLFVQKLNHKKGVDFISLNNVK